MLSFTAVQDAGRAIHPSYVEGQMQGGAVQGIGWALNEEYIYDDNGVMEKLENAGFWRTQASWTTGCRWRTICP